jgi:hypothetical protein
MRAALAAVLVVPLLASTACDDGSSSSDPWCAVAKKHQTAFDTTHTFDRRALAEFEKVRAKAPPALARDLETIRMSATAFARGDVEFYKDPKRNQELESAIQRVNDFLRGKCNVNVPANRT